MKRHAPATARNSVPIANALVDELPPNGLVLEIASGTGEHIVYFARKFPCLEWQPSDSDPSALASICEYAAEAGLGNIRPPIAIDASATQWPTEHAEAILCINMIHISPWGAAVGLFKAAARILENRAPLIIYGPFFEINVATAASNLAFHQDLAMRNQEWGLRCLEDVDNLAGECGLERTARREMPANNLLLTYRKLA